MDLVGLIKENIKIALNNLYSLSDVEIFIEHPENPQFGDYSTNIAFKLASLVHKSPMTIAETLVLNLTPRFSDNSPINRVEFVTPGFINFYVSPSYLCDLIADLSQISPFYGRGSLFEGKKVLVEYTDPNPFKVFHIGHLMPNVIGESIARLYESQGAIVKRANYQGDVGMHVAKSIWGMQRKMSAKKLTLEDLAALPLNERITFLGQCYAQGATAYKEDPSSVEEIKKLNSMVYARDPEIMDNYEAGRSWSLEYFETLYARLGTKFDFYYFERQTGEKGLEVSEDLLRKQILEESEGALVFRGEKYGLHTRVFVNSQGLPTYEAKDLGLALTKYADYSYDTSIIVTANEVDDYFKVVLKALYMIHPDLAVRTTHISHGVLRFKDGKMSSRTGKVISGDELMNKVKSAVLSKMKEPDDQIADQVGIAAIKYGILKNSIGMNIIYDEDEWLSMSGDTGPYLQYTCVRAKSVLNGFDGELESIKQSLGTSHVQISDEEMMLLRLIQKYPEIVRAAALDILPNKICTYLNTLSREFNSYYAKTRILDSEPEELKGFRLILTSAIAQVLENGLNILGITVPERM